MKTRIVFWNILKKDLRNYYLKPPNISWGIIFPFAWTLMFFIKSGSRFEDVRSILPGIVAMSVLFGTTLILAALPFILWPLSYILPLTYGADILHGAINMDAQRTAVLNLAILAGFCIILFWVSIRNVRRKWIY